eukprot:jgi/Botrbrau1/14444/Bobra.0014s0089.1
MNFVISFVGTALLLSQVPVFGFSIDPGSVATVLNDCSPSTASPRKRAVFSEPDQNCCRLQMPSGFDLIPIGVTSKRLIVPAAEVNLQLSPYKRAKDREPSYYVAGKGRAVLPDPKSPIPGSFDDISRGPLSDNTTESVRTAPTSVFDVSNIRLSGLAGAVEFSFRPTEEDAHTTMSFLLLHPCCQFPAAVPAASELDSNTSVWVENPRGCFVELAFVVVAQNYTTGG